MIGHLPELIIILVIALIVFGPEKLPEAAANAGKMVREMREVMDTALHPEDHEVPEDFSAYYYESLERSGDDVPEVEDEYDALDDDEEPATVIQEEHPSSLRGLVGEDRGAAAVPLDTDKHEPTGG